MESTENKKPEDPVDEVAPEETMTEASDPTPADATEQHRNHTHSVRALTDKWKRALADAENARKRADTSHLEGRDHGICVAVEALAPAYDAIALAIETAKNSPEADTPALAAHLEGLRAIRAAFETGIKALGVRTIAPKDMPFDPQLHEAVQIHETEEAQPGEVLVLHRPGFGLGRRLIRPAHVTVSAAPSKAEPS